MLFRSVVERLVARFLSSARTRGASLDWKTSLQELVAAHGLGNPRYEVESVGPDHERVFTAQAIVDGEARGEGTGTSKKLAEHAAAEAAYAAILASHGDGGLDLPGVNEALRTDLAGMAARQARIGPTPGSASGPVPAPAPPALGD